MVIYKVQSIQKLKVSKLKIYILMEIDCCIYLIGNLYYHELKKYYKCRMAYSIVVLSMLKLKLDKNLS